MSRWPCELLERHGVEVTRLPVDMAGRVKADMARAFVRRGVRLAPTLLGAGHERGLRPGTENVASIVGLGVACELATGDLDEEANRQRALRDELWEKLSAAIPGVLLNGHPTERLPNTLNVSFPGTRGGAVLAARVRASVPRAVDDARADRSGRAGSREGMAGEHRVNQEVPVPSVRKITVARSEATGSGGSAGPFIHTWRMMFPASMSRPSS